METFPGCVILVKNLKPSRTPLFCTLLIVCSMLHSAQERGRNKNKYMIAFFFFGKEYRRDKPELIKIITYNVWMRMNRRIGMEVSSELPLYIVLTLDHANTVYI